MVEVRATMPMRVADDPGSGDALAQGERGKPRRR